MTASALHIREWRNAYRVDRTHPAPERARIRLDEVARGVAGELARHLAVWFEREGDAVVLIRHLHLHCELDLSGASERLAARWAGRFARALMDAMDAGEGVMRFPDQAAYRARFITDLVAGRAWQAWYYRPFAGLRALPAAAVIRSVLVEDPALGRATLLALPDSAWSGLAATLSAAEARRTLHALSDAAVAEEPDIALLSALPSDAAGRLPDGVQPEVRALALAVCGWARGLAPTPSLTLWARIAAAVGTLLAHAGPVVVRRALAGADPHRLAAPDAQIDIGLWQALVGRPHWREALAATAAAPRPAATPGARASRFAALALLLPGLQEIVDAELAAALPPWTGPAGNVMHARNLVGWLALAHCAGATRADAFVADAFWRDFFGIAPRLDRTQVRDWLAQGDTEQAQRVLAARAGEQARGNALDAFLRCDGTRLPLRVDEATAIWLGWSAQEWPPDRQGLLARARRARSDWRYLHAEFDLPGPWPRVLAQLAQLVLRRFAWRIPGFAGMSLPYLYANFLAAGGRSGDNGRLRLIRPPLYTLLNLTGLARSVLGWSGPPARSLTQDYER